MRWGPFTIQNRGITIIILRKSLQSSNQRHAKFSIGVDLNTLSCFCHSLATSLCPVMYSLCYLLHIYYTQKYILQNYLAQRCSDSAQHKKNEQKIIFPILKPHSSGVNVQAHHHRSHIPQAPDFNAQQWWATAWHTLNGPGSGYRFPAVFKCLTLLRSAGVRCQLRRRRSFFLLTLKSNWCRAEKDQLTSPENINDILVWV